MLAAIVRISDTATRANQRTSLISASSSPREPVWLALLACLCSPMRTLPELVYQGSWGLPCLALSNDSSATWLKSVSSPTTLELSLSESGCHSLLMPLVRRASSLLVRLLPAHCVWEAVTQNDRKPGYTWLPSENQDSHRGKERAAGRFAEHPEGGWKMEYVRRCELRTIPLLVAGYANKSW